MDISWYKSLGTQEFILLGIFGLLYALFVWRTFRAANSLKTGASKVWIKLVLRTIYVVLIIFALLGPSFGKIKREVEAVGKDIYIALDLSGSMSAEDVAPSRLDKVKFELKKISDAFSTDRLGIIIFSSEAFVQCPLTFDQQAVQLFIETLNTNLVPKSGTDFAPPLEMALEKHLSEEKTVKQTSKVIIFISDGEDFGESASSVAEQIKDAGIRLFTLGVGTESGARVPGRNGYKRDTNGNEVISRLNSEDLRELAEITKGEYFEINKVKNDVPRLIRKISMIEGEVRESRQMDASANKYYYFLYVALGLIILDVLLIINLLKL